ncbi:hypothetical protein PRZ48_002057 [Zasmidium cellare]|uniref:RRM domain-containing protein n=1 Tax=Zasmidium cellare TaxID=395010 RepID=A0ABR0F407_ZASCE|nr:hypothetical protein PRZ48_002057 [Zasmidium cellare]
MERKPFPYDQESFGDDERISFSKVANKFILEDENGIEWEWHPTVERWTQTITEEEMKQQAEAYKVAGVDEDEPALNPAQKRKEAQLEDAETNPKAAKTGPGATNTGDRTNAQPDTNANARGSTNASANVAPPTRKNTAIWVTGIPTDADREEIIQFFSRFGMIKESVEDDSKRIKMYADDEGNFNGEALIIYQGPESIELAHWYDGEPLRLGDKANKLSIQPADSNYKSQDGNTVKEGGNKPKPSKAKLKAKAEEIERRTKTWEEDDEPAPAPAAKPQQKVLNTVLIRNAFTLHLLEEEPDLLSNIYDDMEDAAESHGEVRNVTVGDKEPRGLVTVRFADAAAAKAFADAINGRSWNGRKLSTETVSGWDVKLRKNKLPEAEKERQEKRRLDKYSRRIEDEA